MDAKNAMLINYCHKVAHLVQTNLGDKHIVKAGKMIKDNITRIGIGIEEKDADESSQCIFLYLDSIYREKMPIGTAAKYAITAYRSENTDR